MVLSDAVPGFRVSDNVRPKRCMWAAAAIIVKFEVITLSQREVRDGAGLNGS